MLMKLTPKLFRCVEVIDETFEVTLFRLGSCSVSAHQARDEQEEEEGGQPQDADDDVDVVLLVPHLKFYISFTTGLIKYSCLAGQIEFICGEDLW